ncbi:protein-associating with the carboxyl-terminal domain of ezrin [Lethenteron reissneri]|uniref:protein-associating with the carboxyl-terminal domain of ezrin n=1 Tax=Lethenteron reissneri TaxID=7753 RepID=UPI002AB68E3B|nr:protein-associating with the carboxyl-terminal domain of ezrin [Lethenteron reissneri]XP_061417449.1 protein-associating with the carboxyl-terminal domain of ezrin [Lethenteron reissneri]
MGAESSALSGLRRDEEEEERGDATPGPGGVRVWAARLGKSSRASLLLYPEGAEERARTAAKHMRTLRHPSILRVLGASAHNAPLESGLVPAGVPWVLTEVAMPLWSMRDAERGSASEVAGGLYSVMQGLLFLHSTCGLTHNSVGEGSVLVTPAGEWRLGGMESSCTFSQATPQFLESIRALRDPDSIPPEETPRFQGLQVAVGHARDVYAFGILAQKLYSLLSDLGEVADGFMSLVETSLLNADPTLRPPLTTLTTHGLFRNDFQEVLGFLDDLTLKSEEQKHEFFKFLLERVQALPENLVANRLVPRLMSPLVLAEPVAVKSFLPHLLTPKSGHTGDQVTAAGQWEGLLSAPAFREHVCPRVCELFSSRHAHVRAALLGTLPAYAPSLTRHELEHTVLPQLLLGLRDSSDELVSSTLHALAEMVPLLGAQTVIGGGRERVFKPCAPRFHRDTLGSPAHSPKHVATAATTTVAAAATPSSSTSSLTSSLMSSPPRRRLSADSTSTVAEGADWPDWESEGVEGNGTNPCDASRVRSREDGHSQKSENGSILLTDLAQLAPTSKQTMAVMNGAVVDARGVIAAGGTASRTQVADNEVRKTKPRGLQLRLDGPSRQPSAIFSSSSSSLSSSPSSLSSQQQDARTDAHTAVRDGPAVGKLSATVASSSSSSPTQPSLSLHTSKASPSQPLVVKLALAPKAPPSTRPLQLGEEFKITAKGRRWAARDTELDLFADMEPTITFDRSDSCDAAATVATTGDSHTNPAMDSRGTRDAEAPSGTGDGKTQPDKFAAVAATEDASWGWDEDTELDWSESGWQDAEHEEKQSRADTNS